MALTEERNDIEKKCSRCKGTGTIMVRGMDQPARCPTCKGTGKVEEIAKDTAGVDCAALDSMAIQIGSLGPAVAALAKRMDARLGTTVQVTDPRTGKNIGEYIKRNGPDGPVFIVEKSDGDREFWSASEAKMFLLRYTTGYRGGASDADKPAEPKPPGYNAEAVQKEINKDKRIGGKEASAIHRLLKGRHDSADNPYKGTTSDPALARAWDSGYREGEDGNPRNNTRKGAAASAWYRGYDAGVKDRQGRGDSADLTEARAQVARNLAVLEGRADAWKDLREEAVKRGGLMPKYSNIKVGEYYDYYDSEGNKKYGKVTEVYGGGKYVKVGSLSLEVRDDATEGWFLVKRDSKWVVERRQSLAGRKPYPTQAAAEHAAKEQNKWDEKQGSRGDATTWQEEGYNDGRSGRPKRTDIKDAKAKAEYDEGWSEGKADREE